MINQTVVLQAAIRDQNVIFFHRNLYKTFKFYIFKATIGEISAAIKLCDDNLKTPQFLRAVQLNLLKQSDLDMLVGFCIADFQACNKNFKKKKVKPNFYIIKINWRCLLGKNPSTNDSKLDFRKMF
jgi:hypothetical protein